MARLVFIFLLLIHGLIHLLGFIKAFELATVNELTQNTIIPLGTGLVKIMGICWLIASLLFIISAATYLLKKDWWWMIAAGAVLLSQWLIILYWPDAKFGTIANIIFLIVITVAYGNWRFKALVQQELKPFISPVNQQPGLVTPEMLSSCPPIVQQWLNRIGIIGKEVIHSVHLKQQGQMRTKPNSKWMPVAAEQYFTVTKPGFLWLADVKAAPLVHMAGRDKYFNGRGQMLIKLLSLFPVADARGPEIDQGAMVRYLAETLWFPSAALQDYITWEQTSATAARATMTYAGITASGIFTFTPQGDVISFEAKRYYDQKTGPTLETWFISIDGNSYKAFGGIRIPVKSSVTWKLPSGDFTWFKLEITAVAYNETSAFIKPGHQINALPTPKELYETTE
jgi:hypothetical protein